MKVQFDKYGKIPPAKKERLLTTAPAVLTHDSLRAEMASVEAEIRRLQKRLAQALPGNLQVSGSDGYPKYYLIDETGKHYLSRAEIDTAAAYAQQEYDADLLALLEKRYRALSDTIALLEKLDPQNVFGTLSPKRQGLVLPEYLTEEDVRKLWSTLRYEGKGFRDGEKEYYTAKGERVRSKSESDIADRCYYRGILYLYEYPWTLPGAGVWYPDFTVINMRTRKIYLWEHLGMEDDPGYAVRNLRKLRLYQENGFWPGETLLLTHETEDKPLTVREIDALIDQNLV